MDLLGQFLRIAPPFKGRERLIHYWVNRARDGQRIRLLPGGGKIQCDMAIPYESMVWLEREEEADLAALRRLLRPGQTFVDCGANIGLWTLTAAAAVGAQGRVYAFEPNPVTFDKLSRNIRANALEEVALALCAACGREIGKMPFLCSDEHNHSRMAAEADEDVMFVPVRTLDAAVHGGTIHGIKIDVEGNEFDVLLGAREILRQSKPWLCVEFNASLAGATRLRDWNVHQHLRTLGYSCLLMADAAGSPGEHALGDDWGLEGYCNLYYFPRE
jgi:FkbM family methyltransferase